MNGFAPRARLLGALLALALLHVADSRPAFAERPVRRPIFGPSKATPPKPDAAKGVAPAAPEPAPAPAPGTGSFHTRRRSAGAKQRPSAADPQDATVDGEAPPPPAAVVQTLEDGDAKFYVVDHGATWSMHAENVTAESIFRAWHEVGGPEVNSKVKLDYPFTLSLHRVDIERIVERILDGYGHTLHFDADGRLDSVRVYSPEPARSFKTPRLVESLATWREIETSVATLPAADPSVDPVAAPAPVAATAPAP